MKKKTPHILAGLVGAVSLATVSCSSKTKSGDYATYPSNGYGNYGANTTGANTSGQNYGGYGSDQGYANTNTNTNTNTGGGGAYPTTPQNNYGTDYGNSGGYSAPTSNSGQTHTVQRGETLYRISQNYGTTVSNVKAANGLTSDLIRPGDVLVVR